MRTALNKYRILLGIEILILLFLLPGCFRKEQSIYADSSIVLGEENAFYRGEKFSVKPGVYQVRVSVTNVEQEPIYVSVGAEGESFRAIRCNDVSLAKGQEYLDFEMYVVESTEGAYVECNAAGQPVVLDSLEVYRMNWGSRMVVFRLLVFCVGLNFMLCFRERALSQKISKEKQMVFWSLLACVLVAYFPYMTDYIGYASDISSQWFRIEQLKESLVPGTGYTMIMSAGDLFLLFPVLLRKIGFSLMTSYKMFVLAIMAVTTGVAYYSLKRCVKQEYAALFGAGVYVLAPQRLAVVYDYAAIAEAMAICFLPLVVCGMYRLFTEDVSDKRYHKEKLPLVIGLSGVLLAHLSVFIWMVVAILVVCILFLKRTIRKETLVQLMQSTILCLLLNLWYYLPLLIGYFRKELVLPEGSLWHVAPVLAEAFLAALFYLWLDKKRTINTTVRVGIIVFLILLLAGKAVYYVNDVAFTHSPIWLYTAESLGPVDMQAERTLLEYVAFGKFNYLLTGMVVSALTLAGIVIVWVKRRLQWRAKMQKFSEK